MIEIKQTLNVVVCRTVKPFLRLIGKQKKTYIVNNLQCIAAFSNFFIICIKQCEYKDLVRLNTE